MLTLVKKGGKCARRTTIVTEHRYRSFHKSWQPLALVSLFRGADINEVKRIVRELNTPID